MAHLLSSPEVSEIILDSETFGKCDDASNIADNKPVGFMVVHVDTGRSDHQRISFGMLPSDSVGHLKTMIGEEEGVAAEELRLYLYGNELEDDQKTLDEYNVKFGTLFHLAYRESNMLGTFASNVDKSSDDPLIQYLMLPEDQRQKAPVKLRQLREKAKEEGARPFQTFEFVDDSRILTYQQREFLCKFLHFLWDAVVAADEMRQQTTSRFYSSSSSSSNHPRVDLRAVVPEECFVRLLGFLDGDDDNNTTNINNSSDEQRQQQQQSQQRRSPSPAFKSSQRVLTKLHSLHKRVPNVKFEPKIALRMTRGPTNGCIQFHCDGPNVTSTAQIPLNEPTEYKGGRLCFFVNDTLHVLRRLPGSLIQHPPGVLLGVTALTEGTRMSLFVVDEPNGLDEDGVICVDMDAHVEPFLASQPAPIKGGTSKAGLCVVCNEHFSTHVLVPCGHLCLCPDCVSMVDGPCPVCRSIIQGRHKVYF